MTLPLPLEILTAIVKELDDVQDLRHVRMACHALCAVATPIAFRTLSVIATKGSAQNLGRLIDLPDIAAHVREVSYYDTGEDRRGRWINYVRSNVIHELASSFSRIHQLSHLKAINLTFYPINDNRVNSDNGGRFALQASIFDALGASFQVRHGVPSKLTSLSLHNLPPSDLRSLETPPFQNVLKTLRRLQLSVIFHFFVDQSPLDNRWCDFWSTFCPRIILNPTQHSLTDLTLHSDIYVGALSRLSFAGLHFPHLYALSLRNIVFEPSVGVETFILRHAASLARLELLACKLPTYPRFWNPSPPSAGYCCWDIIWDRFAAELTALVALHADNTECSYVSSSWGIYLRKSRHELRCTTDAAALQRFHAVVAARSGDMNKESWGGRTGSDVLVGNGGVTPTLLCNLWGAL